MGWKDELWNPILLDSNSDCSTYCYKKISLRLRHSTGFGSNEQSYKNLEVYDMLGATGQFKKQGREGRAGICGEHCS